ncbi:hypothetical protein JHK86_001340 [Glycine max]|nr:hypothetical protein JHK86_001340 [Glycine max]
MSETILSAKNVESLLQVVRDIPVLVIACAGDSLVSLESCQAMASKLVNSDLHCSLMDIYEKVVHLPYALIA